VDEVAVVVRRGRRLLLVRRPPEGRWAGLWEFPRGALGPGETHEDAAARVLRDCTGVDAELGAELLTVRHRVTRFRITLVCLEAQYQAGRFQSAYYPEGRWLAPDELDDYPLSRPQRGLARALVDPGRKRLF
jgi:A/G-specific adenine glycosylase